MNSIIINISFHFYQINQSDDECQTQFNAKCLPFGKSWRNDSGPQVSLMSRTGNSVKIYMFEKKKMLNVVYISWEKNQWPRHQWQRKRRIPSSPSSKTISNWMECLFQCGLLSLSTNYWRKRMLADAAAVEQLPILCRQDVFFFFFRTKQGNLFVRRGVPTSARVSTCASEQTGVRGELKKGFVASIGS